MPDLSRWETSITEIAPGHVAPRGRRIADLIDQREWTWVMWLVLFGDEPSSEQEDALRRALVAAVDHGLAAPSTATSRIVASTRVAPAVALSAGLLAFSGPAHGGAAEEAAVVLRQLVQQGRREDLDSTAREIVHSFRSRNARLPGFGHPYHPVDPRVESLLLGGPASRHHRDGALALERAVREEVSPSIRMNADAAVAGLLLDAGLRPDDINLVTALGRAVGLAAHVREEMTDEKPFRAPALDTIEYAGPAAAESA